MARRGRVVVVILCITAGLLIVAAAGVRIVLTRERLLTLVVPRIEQRVGAKISIGDIGIKFPFGFGVDVKDLVFEKQLPDTSHLSVAMERVNVKASLVSLIRKKPEIDRVDMRGGDVSLTRTPRGIDVRITGLDADLSVKPVDDRFLASARVSMDSVTLVRPAIDERRTLRDISLQGEIETDRAINAVQIKEMIVSWADLITVRLSGEVADPRGERRVALRVESTETPAAPLVETILALRLEEMSYRTRGTGLGEKLPAAVTGGMVGFDATIAGSAREPSAMEANGRVDLSGLEVTHPALGRPVRIDGSIGFTDTGARADGLKCALDRSSATVGFNAMMSAETGRIESIGFDIDAELDISELSEMAEERGAVLSGTVRAAIKGKGRPETFAALFPTDPGVSAAAIQRAWQSATLDGVVNLDGIAASSEGNPLVITGCTGDITLSGGDIDRMEIAFLLNASPYTVSGSMRRIMPAAAEMVARFDAKNPPGNLGTFLSSVVTVPDVSLDIKGRSFDTRPFEPAPDEASGGGSGARGAVPDGGEPQQETPNPFAGNPLALVVLKNTAFTARIDSIIAVKAIMTDIDAQGSIRDGMLSAAPVAMRYAGGSGNAVLDVDFRDPQRIETGMHLSFEEIDAGRALGRMSSIGNLVEGRFSFTADGTFFVSPRIDPLMTLAVSGSATSKTGRISMPQIATSLSETVGLDLSRLERFEFTRWIGNFTIRDGRMFTEDWQISSGSGNWDIRGSFGFDGSLEYIATLVIPLPVQKEMKDLSKYGDLVDLFKDEQGNIVLGFAVGGVVQSPKIQLDRSMMKQKAGEKLLDELKKKAKGFFDR